MKKKPIIISILVAVLIIAAIVGTMLYRRDSNGKPFKASLNHSKVMMTPNWNATVKLTANKGATYQVLNKDNKVVKDKHATTDGKATIKLTKVGDYTIVAKSDNGHVSKKLPVKVSHYQAQINKWTNAVGPLKFKITSVDYRLMSKRDSDKPDTSMIDEIFDQLNDHYYQVQVNYVVENTGNKAVNPQYTMWLPESDDNQEFSVQTPTADGAGIDSIIGTAAINPKSKRSGNVIMISNNKFSVQNMKFSIDEVLGNNGSHISKGGIAKLK